MGVARIRSKQIQHENIVLDEYLDDKYYRIQNQELIIQALINLLISKNILTEEEINDYIDSLKIMNKLIGE